MTPDVEQLRAVLDRLIAGMVRPGGERLEQDEVEIIICLGKLQFIASDLRETRMAQGKRLGEVSC